MRPVLLTIILLINLGCLRGQTVYYGVKKLNYFVIDMTHEPLIIEKGYFGGKSPLYEILEPVVDSGKTSHKRIYIAVGEYGKLSQKFGGKHLFFEDKNWVGGLMVKLKEVPKEKVENIRNKMFTFWIVPRLKEKIKQSEELKRVNFWELVQEEFLLFIAGKVIPDDAYVQSVFEKIKQSICE